MTVRSIPIPEIMISLLLALSSAAAVWVLGQAREEPLSQVARGEQIFNREGCVFCHSITDYSPEPMAASRNLLMRLRWNWARNGPDLALEPGRRTDDWHLAHLMDPSEVMPGCPMPSFAGLPERDLQALIAFLQGTRTSGGAAGVGLYPSEVGGREIADVTVVPLTVASYRKGRQIYRLYCQGCHGAEGNGNGSVGHLLWPEPRDFTDTSWMLKQGDAYLFQVIGGGKPDTAMPGYDGLLSAGDQGTVLAYVKLFTNPSIRQRLEQGFVRGVE